AEVQLIDQPTGIHPAVGIGGGIPALFVLGAQRATPTEADGPRGADVANVDADEVHIGSVLSGQLHAVVVTGVQHHHYRDGNRDAQGGSQHRAQTRRKIRLLIVGGNHHDGSVVTAKRGRGHTWRLPNWSFLKQTTNDGVRVGPSISRV